MAIWDKVKQGIDKAGKAAQDVIDEGKLRIDAYRAREQADKAAEALGYAVFRAMDSGHELETSARERLVSALRERENEAKRLEAELAAAKAAGEADTTPAGDGATAGSASAAGTSAPPPTTPADTSPGEPGA
jgi:hypothetical protein